MIPTSARERRRRLSTGVKHHMVIIRNSDCGASLEIKLRPRGRSRGVDAALGAALIYQVLNATLRSLKFRRM